jgi:hypothetical protein
MSASSDAGPVERFKPTSGMAAGYAGLAMALFAIGYCAFAVHTVVGLRVALFALFAMVVIWVSQLRPRATAYADWLVLHGSVHDVRIPYRAVEHVSVTQMLNVWAHGKRYVCVGIGKGIAAESRERAKKLRERDKLQSGLRAGRSREFSEMAEAAAPEQTAMSYHTFVVTKIEELVDRAKRSSVSEGDAPAVTKHLAVPEVVALVVTGAAALVSLLV